MGVQVVSPDFQKNEIIFNIEKGIYQNVLETRELGIVGSFLTVFVYLGERKYSSVR